MSFKKISLIVLAGCLLVLGILAAGCTDQPAATQTESKGDVSIGYVTWDSEIASTNVLKQAFEKAGYDVEIVAVDAGPLYQAVANGDVDCTVSAWLPATQANYWAEYGNRSIWSGRIWKERRSDLSFRTVRDHRLHRRTEQR